MAETTRMLPPASSNTNKIIHGSPSNILLGANLVLLGAVLASQYYLNQKIHDAGVDVATRLHEASTEVRLLQMQMQDQTAVMIREGLIKPGDLTKGPTSGGSR